MPNAAEQTEAVLTTMNVGLNLLTTACCLVIVVLYIFYDMSEKKHAEIRRALEQRSAENA